MLSSCRPEPHYGWADVVGDSSQLLSIQPRERPPGVYPALDFGSSQQREEDQEPDALPSSHKDDSEVDEFPPSL